MRCSACDTENPAAARFCNGCGARLEAACPQCGQLNPPGSRFCNACGQGLATPPPPTPAETLPTPAAYTPKHLAEKILTSRGALEGERKQVTVLFADLKGSTDLIRDLDPEEAHPRGRVNPAKPTEAPPLRFAELARRERGIALAVRVGLNSGDVVVLAI